MENPTEEIKFNDFYIKELRGGDYLYSYHPIDTDNDKTKFSRLPLDALKIALEKSIAHQKAPEIAHRKIGSEETRLILRIFSIIEILIEKLRDISSVGEIEEAINYGNIIFNERVIPGQLKINIKPLSDFEREHIEDTKHLSPIKDSRE